MADGYFNSHVSEAEKCFAAYVTCFMLEKEPQTRSKVLRNTKIAAYAVLKLNLPVGLVWYMMGLHTKARLQSGTVGLDNVIPTLEQEFNVSMTKLDEVLEEGREVFGKDLSGDEIRRKQYELLGQEDFIAKLDLEIFLRNVRVVFDKHEEFVERVSQLTANLPNKPAYEEITEILFEFGSLGHALLNHSGKKDEVISLIFNSGKKIIEYLDWINAKNKKLEGHEQLFTPVNITEFQMKQRAGNARNGIFQMKQFLEQNVASESASLTLDKDEATLHKEATKLLSD